MPWYIGFTPQAEKQLKKLDKLIQSRIKKAVYEKLIVNPNLYLIPLLGDKTGFYKFRVGDYRLLCHKNQEKLIVTFVKVKHRKDAYT